MPDAADDARTGGQASAPQVGDTGPAAPGVGIPHVLPVPEVDTVTLPVTETRASRRAAREAASAPPPPDPAAAEPTRLLVLAASVALAALVGVSALSGQTETGLALAFCGVVLAWGWPLLLDAPTPGWSSAVIGSGAVAVAMTVGLTREEDLLRWLPAAIGVSIVVGFLQQLLRRDRSTLTLGIASTVAGLALATSGATLVALPAYRLGPEHVLVAMGALVLTAVVELLGRVPAVRSWVLLPALVAGVGGAVLTGLVTGGVGLTAAVLLGLLVGGVSHVLRRTFSPLPGAATPAGQLSIGAASVLAVGVVAYLLTRFFVA